MNKYLLILFTVLSFSSCIKLEAPPGPEESQLFVTTQQPVVTSTTITMGGSVSGSSSAFVKDRGICVSSTSSNPVAPGDSISFGTTGFGNFQEVFTYGTAYNTLFYVRAYAVNSFGNIFYGNVLSFRTPLSPPVFSTNTSSLPNLNAVVGCCTVNFSWPAVSGATGYDIQLSRNSAFSASVVSINACGSTSNIQFSAVNQASVSSTTFCVNKVNSTFSGTWFWRVRTRNAAGSGPWSTTRSYTMNP
jgi:hypothetical protein